MGDNHKPSSIDRSEAMRLSDADHRRLASLKGKARIIVYKTPEVRPEKVAQLKEAIEQGTYEIDSEKLADILIDELLLKR